MKCDDDTFVRLDSIISEVRKVGIGRSLYIGNMNYHHTPLRDGKWAVTYEVWFSFLCFAFAFLILKLTHCFQYFFKYIRSILCSIFSLSQLFTSTLVFYLLSLLSQFKMNIILESEKQNRFSQSKRGLSILLLVDQIVLFNYGFRSFKEYD
jgi:hypothetical protein